MNTASSQATQSWRPPVWQVLLYLALWAVVVLCAWQLADAGWRRVALTTKPWFWIVLYGGALSIPLFHLLMMGYLATRFRLRTTPPPSDDTIDVFVTVVDEPEWLVEDTLTAARDMRGPHRTYLLDDGGVYEAVARRVGVEYIHRGTRKDGKAGNVNHALSMTQGDLVVLLDVDHRPEPEFLERTAGHFRDPGVGFLQAMITFSNSTENVFARASAQTGYEYYNISCCGQDGAGGASKMGTNSIMRRSALKQIGGYHHGLADDLETSLALHAAGWKSVYVREPLAPGRTPADLKTFFKQQIKWSAGIFGAAVRSVFDRRFWRLTWSQKLCYLLRFTYRLFGVYFVAVLSACTVNLVWPVMDIEHVGVWLVLGLAAAAAMQFTALRMWALEPEARRATLFLGLSLVASSWTAFTLAFAATVLRMTVPARVTPKEADHRLPSMLVVPQLVLLCAAVAAVVYRLMHWQLYPMPYTTGLVLMLLSTQWLLLYAVALAVRARFSEEYEAKPVARLDTR